MYYLKPTLFIFFLSIQHFIFAQCEGPETLPSDVCTDAPFGCLEGACWRTSAEPKVDGTKDGFCSSCGAGTIINNPQYFWFTARCQSICFNIDITDCSGGNNSLQLAFIRPPTQDQLDCDQWTCADVLMCLNGVNGSTQICYDNFVTDENYLLLIDGSSGASCQYKISQISRDANGDQCIVSSYPLDEIQSSISGPSIVCPGETAIYSIDNVPAASTYKWSVNGGDYQISHSGQASVNIPRGLPDGSVIDLCVHALNGCDSTSTVCRQVTLQKIPETVLKDTSVCRNELPALYKYYNWISKKNDNKLLTEGPNEFLVPTLRGCDSIIKINLIVLEIPDSARIDTAICFSNGDEQWFYEENQKNYFPGRYDISFKSGKNDCDSIVSLNIVGIRIIPGIKATGSLQALYPINRFVIMDGSEGISEIYPAGVYAPGDITYEWTLPDGTKVKNDGVLKTYKPGKFTLTICASKFGVTCCQSLVWKISATGTETPKDSMHNFKPFIYVPNAFSPNGDGNNDVFRVYDDEHSILNINRLSIADRSGIIVYEENNTTPVEMSGWNGTDRRGNQQKEGVYTYYLEVVLSNLEIKVMRGNITLFP